MPASLAGAKARPPNPHLIYDSLTAVRAQVIEDQLMACMGCCMDKFGALAKGSSDDLARPWESGKQSTREHRLAGSRSDTATCNHRATVSDGVRIAEPRYCLVGKLAGWPAGEVC